MNNKILLFSFLLFFTFPSFAQKKSSQQTTSPAAGSVWSAQKAAQWYHQHKWITGANFLPSTAINQLEMWQADTFDLKTIDRELGWAEDLGFNSVRVF
ncbi:MAG TPA: 1,4-beta-xylanase, partial [Flavisolibacter sp.]|nr:1,4-beta-xylanase [Flavisolibacter sp.]